MRAWVLALVAGPGKGAESLAGRVTTGNAAEMQALSRARRRAFRDGTLDSKLRAPHGAARLPLHRDDMRACETVRRIDLLQRATLVLNRSWRPVHVTTVRRALCMVFRE